MVYGFAKQSGGQVRIQSKAGAGTSVTLFLPATDGAPVNESRPTQVEVDGGAGESVLFVEDDASVRMLIRDVLQELGYFPIEAAEPESALPILASDQRIDLMISDVGLPGMNGRQLAEVARKHRPKLPILFITGYAEMAAKIGEMTRSQVH
jgi:CheY-like chemotaxis protein